jgi:hypothetical protein
MDLSKSQTQKFGLKHKKWAISIREDIKISKEIF